MKKPKKLEGCCKTYEDAFSLEFKIPTDNVYLAPPLDLVSHLHLEGEWDPVLGQHLRRPEGAPLWSQVNRLLDGFVPVALDNPRALNTGDLATPFKDRCIARSDDHDAGPQRGLQ